MFDMETIEAGADSVTATVCEQAQLFGATPERDEFDCRDVWDEGRCDLRPAGSVPDPGRRRCAGRLPAC